jgi:hypothetical protein
MLNSIEVRKARYDQFLTKAPEGCEKLTCRGCLLHGISPRQDNALEREKMMQARPKDTQHEAL